MSRVWDETMKVWCVMQVLRQLPEERGEAREVLKLVNDLAPMYGYDDPQPKKAGRTKARGARS
jgi:hypothetical protein